MTEAGNKRNRDAAEVSAEGAQAPDATKKLKRDASVAEQAEEVMEITKQDEEQQPEQMEDVDAGDAAYGAGNDGAAEEAGPLQGAEATADGNEEGGDAADDGNEEQDKQDVAEPRKIGYKTFSNGHAAFKYYKMLLRELTKNQDLNGYEHDMVLDLLKQGHPNADQKVGEKLRAIQVRDHATEQSVCFHLMRSDGIVEDFSTNKCLATLFPMWSQSRAAKVEEGNAAKRNFSSRGRGRGRGGGRRGGRGRGGGRRGGRGRH